MMSLQRLEKVDRELFRQGYFSLKSTVLTGRKNANGSKLDAIYKREYPSKKYNNIDELEQISISTSDYIVLSYNNFERKINEEVYVSYPNINDLKYFINSMLNMIMSDKVYDSRNQVTMDYKNYQLTSQPFASNKILVAIPTSIERDQNLVRGVYLFINSEDNYIELDVKGVFTLNEIVKSIDLLKLSNDTLNQGLLYKVLELLGNGDTTNNVNNFSNSTPAPRSPLSNRGLFGNNNQGNNRRGFNAPTPRVENTNSNPIKPEVVENPFDDRNIDDNAFNNEPPVASIKPRSLNNKETQNSNKEESGILSMDNIISEAENFKYDESEEELLEF